LDEFKAGEIQIHGRACGTESKVCWLFSEARPRTSDCRTSYGGKDLGRGVALSQSGAAFQNKDHHNDPCSCLWHEFGSLEGLPARRQTCKMPDKYGSVIGLSACGSIMALVRSIAQRSGLQRQKLTNDLYPRHRHKTNHSGGISASYREAHE